MIWYLSSFEDRYHQISFVDNYDKFYLLVLFDSISMSFSQGAGFGVRQCQINHSPPLPHHVTIVRFILSTDRCFGGLGGNTTDSGTLSFYKSQSSKKFHRSWYCLLFCKYRLDLHYTLTNILTCKIVITNVQRPLHNTFPATVSFPSFEYRFVKKNWCQLNMSCCQC